MYINGWSKTSGMAVSIPVKYAIDYNEEVNIATLMPFTKITDLGSKLENLIFHRNDAYEIKDAIKVQNAQCLFTNTNKVNYFRRLNRKIRLLKVVVDENNKVTPEEEVT